MRHVDGIAWAASAMVAARTRLEIAAGNLANVSTDGFSRTAARGFLTALGVAIAREPARSHGELRRTGRDLDLAILGEGAFRVRAALGRIGSTRAGAFVRDSDGTLRDAAGRTLLGAHGALCLPGDGRIDPDGRVVAGGRVVDALALAPGARLQRGFLEGPGVDAIAEMIAILAAERSFESAQKAVTAIDLSRQKAAESARIT
jgi:flagellar basal body rod protein FlgG